MAVVARTRRQDHILSGCGIVMDQCLAAGLPVGSACSGRGACGKCVMRVLRGADSLCPPSPHEAAVLARNGAGADERLSCQFEMSAVAADLLVTTGYW